MKKQMWGILGSCLLVIVGFCAVTFPYFKEKKDQAFEMMNLKLLEYQNKDNEDRQETPKDEALNQLPDISNVEESTATNQEQTQSSYLGYLEIPKIKLRKGFLPIDSPYNNINYHVTIHAASSYPDVKNGNFILMAHSGTAGISYFKNLYQLGVHDIATVTYKHVKYQYEIVSIYNVAKTGQVEIKRNRNKNTLTLITCTYEDDNSQTIYIAELISEESI